jgi:hypothetical protein
VVCRVEEPRLGLPIEKSVAKDGIYGGLGTGGRLRPPCLDVGMRAQHFVSRNAVDRLAQSLPLDSMFEYLGCVSEVISVEAHFAP